MVECALVGPINPRPRASGAQQLNHHFRDRLGMPGLAMDVSALAKNRVGCRSSRVVWVLYHRKGCKRHGSATSAGGTGTTISRHRSSEWQSIRNPDGTHPESGLPQYLRNPGALFLIADSAQELG